MSATRCGGCCSGSAGRGGRGVGYSAAALADGLAGCPVHVLVRLAAGSVFYADPVTWEGRHGRPARRGAPVHCLEPADFTAAGGSGPRGRKKPLPPNLEPDEELALPGTPLYGTVRAEAWHRVHPLVHVTVERLPDGRDPHRAMWLWHAGPGPLSLDELWRAYLARFDIEHAFKLLNGSLGLTAARVRSPEQVDRWARVLMTAHAQLLLARPLGGDLRRRWEKQPDPAGRSHRAASAAGFATSALSWGRPPVSRDPPGPGPAGPKAAAKAQLPATFSPAKPTCRAPRTRR